MRALGNDLILGASGESNVSRISSVARATHLYVCGGTGTGTGKSKFLEHLIRQDIKAWSKSKCGLILLNPHGNLYDSLVRWCAWNDLKRSIIPIDLRNRDSVIAYNVLRKRSGTDPNVVVAQFVQAMAHVWGQAGTTATPLFARWASNVIGTLYEKGFTLLDAEYLLDRMAKHIRFAMTGDLQNRSAAQDWSYANSLSPKDFEAQIGSTLNRLHAFLSTDAIRLMLGQAGPSLDLGEALREGHMILVNLSTEGGRISDDDASLFATLLLADLWTAAKERGKNSGHKPYYVYCDEFQRFITPTIAQNLDEARGYGIHLTLAHQFPNQLLHTGAHGKQVYDSIMANARSKVVFGLEGEENLRPLAQSLFMGAMSPEKIKLSLYSTKVLDYAEETRTTFGINRSSEHSQGRQLGRAGGQGMGGTEMYPFLAANPAHTSESESKFDSFSNSESNASSHSESTSEAEQTVLIPQLGKELSSVQFESLEEQLFRSMAVLFDQAQRQFVARIVGSRTPVPVETPIVHDTPCSEARLARYVESIQAQWPFISRTADAEQHLAERDALFLPSPPAPTAPASPIEIFEEPRTARRRLP